GSGAADRLCARARARGRRVRLGDLHRRKPAQRVGNRASAHRHQIAGVPLRRRDRHCGRHAARVVPVALRHQWAAALVRSPHRETPLTVLPLSEYAPHDDALIATAHARPRPRSRVDTRDDPVWVRGTVITLAIAFLGLFIVLPLINVFAQALVKGIEVYFAALTDPEALA